MGRVAVILVAAVAWSGCTSGGEPAPSPPSGPPVIEAFRATPSTVTPGAAVRLAWTVTDATSVAIDNGIGTVSGDGTTVVPPATTTYTLTASNGAGTATAQVQVLVASHLVVAGGNGLQAPPGAAPADAPSVRVQDVSGIPVPGIEVAFAVTEGGGSVERPTATTDADGRATCGAWTLGPARGLNALAASAPGLAPVTFMAVGVQRAPGVTVTLVSPVDGARWPGVGGASPSGTISASVVSTYSVASVTATVQSTVSPAGAQVPLSFSGGCSYNTCTSWVAETPLSGIPRGTTLFLVTATDLLGNSADAAALVAVDRGPVVTALAPADRALSRGTIQVEATCTDDDPAGCTSVIVYGRPSGSRYDVTVLAQGTSGVAATVDLSRFEGMPVDISFVGKDSAEQADQKRRLVYVKASPYLQPLASLPGDVWDVSGSRVLYLDLAGPVPSLRIRDLATDTDTVVETSNDLYRPSGAYGGFGYLTPTGAIYVHGREDRPVSPFVYEWRGGVVSQLSGDNDPALLKVAESFAVFIRDGTLMRRDLLAGTNQPLTDQAVPDEVDVAANGDVVFVDGVDHHVFRWRDGVTAQLTADSPATTRSFSPVTDGAHVVYGKSTPSYPWQDWQIAVHDGALERILADAQSQGVWPGGCYRAAGGWIAYTKEDAQTSRQVWRTGPSAAEPLTLFSAHSFVDGLDTDGTIILIHGESRHRARVGQPLEAIDSLLGRLLLRDGRFLEIVGPHVLEVVP